MAWIRSLVRREMKRLELSPSDMVRLLEGKVPRTTLYDFLSGNSETTSAVLGRILWALNLEIRRSGSRKKHKPGFRQTRPIYKLARGTSLKDVYDFLTSDDVDLEDAPKVRELRDWVYSDAEMKKYVRRLRERSRKGFQSNDGSS